MTLDLYQIDAFTDRIFGGNPACVMPLEEWLPDETLLKIAMENAVAETAYFIIKDDHVHLRWFTPDIEMDLCGHATLASAHCLKSILGYTPNPVVFETMSGQLQVHEKDGKYSMDLPNRNPETAVLPEPIKNALSKQPSEILMARDYVLVYETEEDVLEIEIDRQHFDQINLGHGGVIVTAPGNEVDFVSRFFTPQATFLEDPVTGSAHCSLTPYWANRLNKTVLSARQVSPRGGSLTCEVLSEERVSVSGEARTYLKGQVVID